MDRFLVEQELFYNLQPMASIDHKMCSTYYLSGHLEFTCCNQGNSYALSFYVTKTVLVGPKWFWSDQIDLDLTIMIWSRPK